MSSVLRFRLLVALAALLLLAAGCDGGDGAAEDQPADPAATEGADATGDEETDASGEEADADAADDEQTDDGEVADVDVGCALDLPDEGPGSLDGMAQDPAATAIANNPELSTFGEAIEAADLADTLNAEEAVFTIFAPTNAAFDELGEDELNKLLADQERLTEVVTHHVLGDEELDLQQLVEEEQLLTLHGGELAVEAADEQTVTVDDAEVVCADVQTANAIIQVIDGVLVPEEPAEEAAPDAAGQDATGEEIEEGIVEEGDGSDEGEE